MSNSSEMNMCEGSIFPKIMMFALPLIAANILQLLFNAADVVVVGRYAGSYALAAVGSTTSLIELIVHFFCGLSVGTNVIVAHYYGAQDKRGISETVHTSILTAIISGIVMLIIGLPAAKPVLSFMGTPADVIDHSVLYVKIYILGLPALIVYNFGAAILRAAGDTKHPLYYLLTSGVVNVILNLIFVIVFKLGVAGVALATITAEYISAFLIIMNLAKNTGASHLDIKELKIHGNRFTQIMSIGLAAGFQSLAFNISNVQIQSSINSFGSVVVAGSAASTSVEGFTYAAMDSVSQTSLSFMGQNIGAKKYSRINRIIIDCAIITTLFGLVMGVGFYLMGDTIIGIYNSDPAVIESGVYRLSIVSVTQFICSLMEIFAYGLRGLGHSVAPMVITILGACAFRVIWILTVFKSYHTLFSVYISYPISWLITGLALFIYFIKIRKLYPTEDGVVEQE